MIPPFPLPRCAKALPLGGLVALAGCVAPPMAAAPPPHASGLSPEVLAHYDAMPDGERTIPAIDPKYLSAEKARQEVGYYAPHPPGTIIVDPEARFLYQVMPGNRAMRYAVAVGPDGYAFSGEATIPYQREWPGWRPTDNMIKRDPGQYAQYSDGLPGGLSNPLGARALYLFRGARDTHYRIHGTSNPWSIGQATSAGCIRLYNQDIVHLAENTAPGTRVVVVPKEQSGLWTHPPIPNPNGEPT